MGLATRAIAVLCALGGTAAADDVAVPISVRARLVGGAARVTAEFRARVAGPMSHFGSIELTVPASALVVGAAVTADGARHVLALREAGAAQQEFDARSAQRGRPRAWLALISHGSGTVFVSIGAPHTAPIGIELELSEPPCYARGARYIDVPTDWAAALDPAQRVTGKAAAAVTEVCGAARGEAAWLRIGDDGGAARAPDRIGGSAGRLALGDEHLARVEVDLAAQLGDVPPDLATVILVDASRSMTEPRLDAQRELVAAYLRAAPRSRVQVVAYARHARALLPAWTAASVAAPRLDRELRALAPRNGSNVDEGLAEAAVWLARTGGTRRVVVLTDELLPERLSEASPVALKRLLPAGTLVHVVALDEDARQPARDDGVLLGPLAAATDGIGVRSGVPRDAPLDATLLARPVSLDGVTVKAPGWTEIAPLADPPCSDAVAEGHACVWWGTGDPIAGPIVVEGLVWGRRVARVLTPDRARGLDLARELVALGSVAPALRSRVEAAARAVDAAWSLFAAWGGPGGYEAGEAASRVGTVSTDHAADTTTGVIDHIHGSGLPPLALRTQLAPAVSACAPSGAGVAITVETTWLEIVGVKIELSHVDDVPAREQRRLAACVEDNVWEIALAMPDARAHAETSVVF